MQPTLFFAGIVVLILAIAVSRKRAMWRPTRARPYPLWGRIVCGLLAAGLAVAVILGTVTQSQSGYGDNLKAIKYSTLLMPILPPPEVAPDGTVDTDRFLICLVGIHITGAGGACSYINCEIGRLNQEFLLYEAVPDLVHLDGKATRVWQDARRSYKIEGTFGFFHSSEDILSSSLSSFRLPSLYDGQVLHEGLTCVRRNAINLIGNIAPHKSVVRIIPVRREDPLTTISHDEWWKRYGLRLAEVSGERNDRIGESPAAVAAAFVNFGGFALFLLFLATVLAAQCFTHRAVGLVISCFCVVLLVVALDRIVLEIHAGNLAPDKPPAVRAYARSQLDATFFFQKTAEHLAQEK